MILEEQADEEARHQRTQDADFLKHLTDAESLGRRLGLRERLPEERHAVEHGRHQEESELNLPAHVHAFAENPADEAAKHQTGRPAGVQDVQIMRAVLREQRGDERVRDRLERAVRQGKDERADVEIQVCGRLRLPFGRGKGDEGRQHVEREGGDDQFAVADFVDDDAADDDAEAETGEAGAADGAKLRTGEAEVGGPVRQDAAANAGADAGRKNCQEAGP